MNDTIITKEWDFDAGKLPLDFAHTVEWHAGDRPDDNLENYADLVGWSQQAGLLSEVEAQDLIINAKLHRREATKTYKKAIGLRETIYRIISALAGGTEPENSDITNFNRALGNALKKSTISSAADGFKWTWQTSDNSFDRMLWPVLRETANLLTSKDINRVGECADDRGCGYLFFDTSRNHSRRWCSMEDCGNRAKAQRYYQKISKK